MTQQERQDIEEERREKALLLRIIGFIVGVALTIVVLSLCSCRAVKVPLIQYRDSIQYVAHYDTTIIHIKDSAERYVSNDTIYLTKWKSKEVFTIKYDTISDKQIVREPYEVITYKDKVPAWCWWLLTIVAVYVGYKIVRIVIKVYTRGKV